MTTLCHEGKITLRLFACFCYELSHKYRSVLMQDSCMKINTFKQIEKLALDTIQIFIIIGIAPWRRLRTLSSFSKKTSRSNTPESSLFIKFIYQKNMMVIQCVLNIRKFWSKIRLLIHWRTDIKKEWY